LAQLSFQFQLLKYHRKETDP